MTTAEPTARPALIDDHLSRSDRPPRPLRLRLLAVGLVACAAAGVLGVLAGPAGVGVAEVGRILLHLPTAASDQQVTIIEQIRLPRVVLAMLVGATLSVSGASFQGVFRNPLADPWLLGAAAGAGLGVTAVIVAAAGSGTTPPGAPVAAFVGALGAVALTYLLSATSGGRTSTSSLILAGVAVAAFLTAIQTYLQQRNQDTVRQVYSWILGRLSSGGWAEVRLLLPYALVSWIVLLAHARTLDVLAVGDAEAESLGVNVGRARLLVVVAASLGTAAAVAASGLIGFVGIIVPHCVRMVVGRSNRAVLPLSLLFGATFLVIADVLARTVAVPAEIPIGVITAFFGAPFFALVMRASRPRGAA